MIYSWTDQAWKRNMQQLEIRSTFDVQVVLGTLFSGKWVLGRETGTKRLKMRTVSYQRDQNPRRTRDEDAF
jgi:hypothetical protein